MFTISQHDSFSLFFQLAKDEPWRVRESMGTNSRGEPEISGEDEEEDLRKGEGLSFSR
jgi:hypothetical protein